MAVPPSTLKLICEEGGGGGVEEVEWKKKGGW